MDIAKNTALLLTSLLVSGIVFFFSFKRLSALSITVRLLVIVAFISVYKSIIL